jgi:hypothetical protein
MVVDARVVHPIWGSSHTQTNDQILYTKDDLAFIRRQNKKGHHWMLIYILGLSLEDQYNIRNVDNHSPLPVFAHYQHWPFERWAHDSCPSGYRFIDFFPVGIDVCRSKQDQFLTEHPRLVRAPCHIVSEGCVTLARRN